MKKDSDGKIITEDLGMSRNERELMCLSIRQCLAERNITVLEQFHYSPDLAPKDFLNFHLAQKDH